MTSFKSLWPTLLPAGCGFLDTVAALAEMGADIDARDVTDCTPLQVSIPVHRLRALPGGCSWPCCGSLPCLLE
jgi:hypothetical protein